MLLGAGEMTVIPATVWHWHGATPLRDGCHLAIMTRSVNNWGLAPPEDQAEFAAYEDWERWVQGISG